MLPILNRFWRITCPSNARRYISAVWDVVLVENIIYIEEMDAMLAIFQDITDEEAEMERQLQMRMDTVDIAQQVIDKQMTVAQEIAVLLGETTAETKVTFDSS